MSNPSTVFALLILFLPLTSFVFQIFIGHRIGRSAHWYSLAALGLTLGLALSFLANAFISHGYPILDVSAQWFSTGAFSLSLGFYIYNVAAIMLVVVAVISFLVHLYSTEYMRGDPRYTRYFGYLGLFTFSMNGIVLADSLVMMWFRWTFPRLRCLLGIGRIEFISADWFLVREKICV